MNKSKQEEGLVNYLTNIILRPHREVYNIDKLGPSKIVVKSNEKSIAILERMSKNQKHLPKELHQNYCELIEVNRRQITIKSNSKNIQASVYEPQLTERQKNNTDNFLKHQNQNQKHQKGTLNFQNLKKHHKSYENCVVFLHANSGSRLEGIEYSKQVLQYRTLCVSFDYTGSGISEGEYTTMGVNQSKDLSVVLNYIHQKYQIKRFALWGRSMGAVTGLYYLLTRYSSDSNKIKITSCILDSPFSNLQQLILELASKKSNLPQILFKPILKVIEKDIISKLGINIFSELNLIQKISTLKIEQLRLINTVNFLGIASKEDKMIGSEHCEALCELLISRDARNSDLIDQKNVLVQNTSDKHLMMLAQIKKQINMKGDIIYIDGDHNKPRGNQTKEKVSLFIQDSFYSYKDICNNNSFQDEEGTFNSPKETSKILNFAKTGMNVKTKLSFAKGNKTSNIKSRKDSEVKPIDINYQSKPTDQKFLGVHTGNVQSIPQTTTFLNLKEIKAKQQVAKKSLSKQKGISIRNSLNKNPLLKQRQKPLLDSPKQLPQTPIKGLNIVSKDIQKDKQKLKPSYLLSITPSSKFPLTFPIQEQSQPNSAKTIPIKGYQTLQNSMHYKYNDEQEKKREVQEGNNFENASTNKQLKSFLKSNIGSNINSAVSSSIKNNKNYIQCTPKCKVDKKSEAQNTSLNRLSQHNSSVNNSIKMKSPTKQLAECQTQNNLTSLNLSSNQQIPSNQQHFTQRYNKNESMFQSLPSDRYNRNVQSQAYVYGNRLQQSPVVTSPFNISYDGRSNQSIQMNNSFQEQSFRKKQTSQIIEVNDLSLKKQVPKTPKIKLSISQFKQKQEEQNKKSNRMSINDSPGATLMINQHMTTPKYLVIKKENNSMEANSTNYWSQQSAGDYVNNQRLNSPMFDENTSNNKHSMGSLKFKKRQITETNSIHSSDLGGEQYIEDCKAKEQTQPHFSKKQRIVTADNIPATLDQNINLLNGNSSFNNQVNVQKKSGSDSFYQQNGQISMKRMMINSGHKGLTQSSTFNNFGFYGNNSFNAFGSPTNLNNNCGNQFQNKSIELSNGNPHKPSSSNCYLAPNVIHPPNFKSMKTSQQPVDFCQKATGLDQRPINFLQANSNTSQNSAITSPQCQFYGGNFSHNYNFSYNPGQYQYQQQYYPQQVTPQQQRQNKESLQYKTKITRLLD